MFSSEEHLDVLGLPIMAQLLECDISIHMRYFKNRLRDASALGDGLKMANLCDLV